LLQLGLFVDPNFIVILLIADFENLVALARTLVVGILPKNAIFSLVSEDEFLVLVVWGLFDFFNHKVHLGEARTQIRDPALWA